MVKMVQKYQNTGKMNNCTTMEIFSVKLFHLIEIEFSITKIHNPSKNTIKFLFEKNYQVNKK